MKTQRTFEPHEFEAHAEAENICRHCNRGRYALHHQTTEHDDHNAPAALDEWAKCSHSDKSWRLSGNNPADVICEYDYIAIGTTRKHAAQIVTEHNQHSTLIAQRERLLEALDLAANRIDFLTNWIENSYGGTNTDVELGRKYASAAREAITTSEQEGREGR